MQPLSFERNWSNYCSVEDDSRPTLIDHHDAFRGLRAAKWTKVDSKSGGAVRAPGAQLTTVESFSTVALAVFLYSLFVAAQLISC